MNEQDDATSMSAKVEHDDRALSEPPGRAADVIVEHLESLIASGTLVDGEPIPIERDLMTQYNASRTVIREAITSLSSRGFLENRKRFRPVVRKPGLDSALNAVGGIVMHLLKQPGGVKSLYGMRVFLERLLVRDAAENATRSDIQLLKQALAINEAAIPESVLFYQTDMAFHSVLFDITGNPALPPIHRAYTTWLSPYLMRMERSPARNTMNHEHHTGMYLAILERDPDLAEARLKNHLKIGWEHVRDHFEDEAMG